MPSFDEMFPGLRKEDPDCTTRKKHIGDDYYQDAMEVREAIYLPPLSKKIGSSALKKEKKGD